MKLHELKKPCLFHSIHSVQPLLFVLLSNGEPFYLLSLLLYQPLSELTVRWYPPHLPYQMDDDKTRLESKLCQNIVALSTVFLGVLSGQLTDIPSAVVHVSAARRQIQWLAKKKKKKKKKKENKEQKTRNGRLGAPHNDL